jgi:16S rRNA (uracil1498-N3)-methyltransferase
MEATFYMARRRFFVTQIRNDRAEIEGDEARHLSQVLRVEKGQRFEISDNRSVWLAEIELARKEHIVFRTLEPVETTAPLVHTHLYIALIKFDHLETVLEKATELGVESITPVEATRSERGLERGAEKRLPRWRRIVNEASQQSRRARLPEVNEPITFEEALSASALHRLFLDEERSGMPMLDAVRHHALGDTVALTVGPEGGWTEAEREAAREAGWRIVTLGSQILRAETAAIAGLAVVNAAWESDPPPSWRL